VQLNNMETVTAPSDTSLHPPLAAPQRLHKVRREGLAVHSGVDASKHNDVQLVVRQRVALRPRQGKALASLDVHGARVVLQVPLAARAVRAQRARERLHALVDVHVSSEVRVGAEALVAIGAFFPIIVRRLVARCMSLRRGVSGYFRHIHTISYSLSRILSVLH